MRICIAGAMLLTMASGAVFASSNSIVLEWNQGVLTNSQYEGFVRFIGADVADPIEMETARSAALTLELARRAKEAGLADRSSVQMAILRAKAKWLKPRMLAQLKSEYPIGEAELGAALAEKGPFNGRPEARRLGHIFIRKPVDGGLPAKSGSLEAAEQRIDSIYERLKNGEEFAKLAKAESDSQSRFRDGKIGVVEKGVLPPAVERSIFHLPEGAISEPVETADGFHLFKVLQVVPERKVDMALVTERVMAELERHRANQELKAIVDSYADSIEVDHQQWRVAAEEEVLFELCGYQVTPSGLRARLPSAKKLSWQSWSPEQMTSAALSVLADIAVVKVAGEWAEPLDARTEALVFWSKRSALALQYLTEEVTERFMPASEQQLRAIYEGAGPRSYRTEDLYHAQLLRMETAAEKIQSALLLAERIRDGLVGGNFSVQSIPEEMENGPLSINIIDRVFSGRDSLSAVSLRLARVVFGVTKPGDWTPVVHDDGDRSRPQTIWLARIESIQPGRKLSFEESVEQVRELWAVRRSEQLKAEVEADVYEQMEVVEGLSP
ncbi:MAG: hypothetical protein DHS20C11_10410 [Lysobacteraceae bacterium]|nr:MAG: hypothetical protein DHS20C11_10410 [Xanthomonadaceae bacterium]